ncbi:6390_t:CDS:1, partial [Scutellospora calospora]
NFLTIEGNHINAIQGDLNNLTNVGKDYLAAIYDDPIDIEYLAATYNNPIDIEYLTTIYNDPINIEEKHLATVQDNTIDVEKNIVQNENINIMEDLTINVRNSFPSWELAESYLEKYAKLIGFPLCYKHFEINNIGIICRQIFEYSFAGELVSNKVVDS